MSDAHINETLSFLRAFFLYFEQPGAPLNVASISAFEGIIPLDSCREYVASKLPLIPRFLQRPVTRRSALVRRPGNTIRILTSAIMFVRSR